MNELKRYTMRSDVSSRIREDRLGMGNGRNMIYNQAAFSVQRCLLLMCIFLLQGFMGLLLFFFHIPDSVFTRWSLVVCGVNIELLPLAVNTFMASHGRTVFLGVVLILVLHMCKTT